MKTRQIKVDNLNDYLAGIIINIFENKKNGPPTIQLILSKLIQNAEGCEIHDSITVCSEITKELNLTKSNFRKTFFKLSKLGIVIRDKSTISIHPALRSDFNSILLVNNTKKY